MQNNTYNLSNGDNSKYDSLVGFPFGSIRHLVVDYIICNLILFVM